MSDGLVLRVDSRNRISLGDLAQHQFYLANVETDGVIVLVPAVVRPASLRDPHGAPAGSAERARTAAEQLPTVGQWPGHPENYSVPLEE